jgi:hypothetical protein
VAGERSNRASGKFRQNNNIAAAGLFWPRRKRQNQGETLMATPLQHMPLPHTLQQQNPSETHASNELIKLIRKLRWIGMDEEAQKLQTELTQREAAAEDSVVATPRETD